MLYLHGGGFVACSPATHRDLAARLAIAASAQVVALDYRLAPEHPFRAALDDCIEAYLSLLGRYQARQLVLAGDSSGAGLAVSAMVRLEEIQLSQPAGAVLFSPWVDLTNRGRSIAANARTCYLLPAAITSYIEQYLQGHDPLDPLVSPLHADLAGLPPLLIQTSAMEMLHSDATALAERAKAAGVQVTLQADVQLFHAYQTLAPLLPEARRAIALAGEYVAARVARPNGPT